MATRLPIADATFKLRLASHNLNSPFLINGLPAFFILFLLFIAVDPAV